MKNKIVFFGTPWFGAEILRFLLEKKVPVIAIVTQPDRPRGRSLQIACSPVKEMAQKFAPQTSLFQPEKCSEEWFLQKLRDLKADLFVVAAFGQILPQKLLDIPRLGSLNVHTSLLPKYRGAAPIQRAILAGEKETGVAIQKVALQLDRGDVVASAKVSILPDITSEELEQELLARAQPLLFQILEQYEKGAPPAHPQREDEASYAPKIEWEEGRIDWRLPAEKIHDLVRAFSPRPGAWCQWEEKGKKKQLKILRTQIASSHLQGIPGELSGKDPLMVFCGQGSLFLLQVQAEGKRPMSGAEWLRGTSARPRKFLVFGLA